MANPVEEFLLQKKAFNMGGMGRRALPSLQRAGEAAATGVLTGVGAAGFAGLVGAAGKIYNAATKTRDFNNMLEANPDLHHHLQEDPAGFNRLFTSLRTLAPDFTREPLVAGTYMRNGLEGSVENRGSIAVRAMNDLRPKQGPATEAALGGYMKGLGDKPEGKKPQLMRQTKTVSRPNETGEPAVERIEEAHNYYG